MAESENDGEDRIYRDSILDLRQLDGGSVAESTNSSLNADPISSIPRFVPPSAFDINDLPSQPLDFNDLPPVPAQLSSLSSDTIKILNINDSSTISTSDVVSNAPVPSPPPAMSPLATDSPRFSVSRKFLATSPSGRARDPSIGFLQGAEQSAYQIEEEFERVVLTRMPKYRWNTEQKRSLEEKEEILEEFYAKIDAQSDASLQDWIKRLQEESCTADDLECLADILEDSEFDDVERFVNEAGISQLIQTCKAKSYTELFQNLNYFTMKVENFQTEPIFLEGHSFYLSIARLLNVEAWELAFAIGELLGIDPDHIGEWPVAERLNEETQEWARDWNMEEVQCVSNHLNATIRIWVIENDAMFVDSTVTPEKDGNQVDKFLNLLFVNFSDPFVEDRRNHFLPLYTFQDFVSKENNPENLSIDLAVLGCLAAVIDTPPSKDDNEDQVSGIDLVINHQEAIRFIVSQWDKNDMLVREAVLQILASMSWFSRHEGFPKVFDMLNWYRELHGYRSFWTPFVESLEANMEQANYARHVVKLINVMLLCVQEFDSRVEQRRSLEAENYQEILDELISFHSSKGESGEVAIELIGQIELYETIKEEDIMKSTYQDLDLANPDAVYDFLKETCLEAGTLNELTKCLHLLAAIPRHQEPVWTNCQMILAETIQPKSILRTDESGAEYIEVVYPTIDDLKAILKKNEVSTDSEERINALQKELADLKHQIHLAQLQTEQSHYNRRSTLLASPSQPASHPPFFPNLSSIASFASVSRRRSTLRPDVSSSSIPTTPPDFGGSDISIVKDDSSSQVSIELPADKRDPPKGFNTSKYQRMKGMGIPEASIKHKIRADGFNDRASELFEEFVNNEMKDSKTVTFKDAKKEGYDPTLPEVVSEAEIAPDDVPKGFDLKKYQRMQKMGLPEASIRHKIRSDGFEEDFYEIYVLGTKSKSDASKVEEDVEHKPEPPKGFDVDKYKRMKKMGLPEVAIRHKIKSDGFDEILYDQYIDPKPGAFAKEESEEAVPEPPKGFDVSKYQRMKKMGLPEVAIRHKIKSDGFDEILYDQYVDPKPGAFAKEEEQEAAPEPPKGFDVKKYQRMKKMGLPEVAIRHKIKSDGFDESLYDEFIDPKPGAGAKAEPPKPPDGFDVAKYQRMKKMGLPEMTIRHKIRSDGFDEKLYDVFVDPKPGAVSKSKKSSKKRRLVRAPSEPLRGGPTPTKKMKNFYWEKLTFRETKDMPFWQMSADEEFDVNQFEDWFARGAPKVIVKKKTKSKAKTTISLFPGKRVDNVVIGLSKWKKMSFEHIKTCILTFDMKTFDLESLSQIRGIVPDPEEVAVISAFEGDVKSLDRCGQFFHVMKDIPDVKNRLKEFQFLLSFDEMMQEITDDIHLIIEALEAIEKNESLKSMFSLILTCGNFLNFQTKFGNAWGFKLTTLEQLSMTKSNLDRTQSLLSFIVKTAREHPEKMKFVEDLDFSKVLRVDLSDIKGRINTCKMTLKGIQQHLENPFAAKVEHDMYASNMTGFYKRANEKVKEAIESFKKADSKIGSLAKQFGEDPGLEFVEKIDKFRRIIKQDVDDAMKREEAKSKAERKAQKKAQKKLMKLKKKKEKDQQKEEAKLNSQPDGMPAKQQSLRLPDKGLSLHLRKQSSLKFPIAGTLKRSQSLARKRGLKPRARLSRSSINSGSEIESSHGGSSIAGSERVLNFDGSLLRIETTDSLQTPQRAASIRGRQHRRAQSSMWKSPNSGGRRTLSKSMWGTLNKIPSSATITDENELPPMMNGFGAGKIKSAQLPRQLPHMQSVPPAQSQRHNRHKTTDLSHTGLLEMGLPHARTFHKRRGRNLLDALYRSDPHIRYTALPEEDCVKPIIHRSQTEPIMDDQHVVLAIDEVPI